MSCRGECIHKGKNEWSEESIKPSIIYGNHIYDKYLGKDYYNDADVESDHLTRRLDRIERWGRFTTMLSLLSVSLTTLAIGLGIHFK